MFVLFVNKNSNNPTRVINMNTCAANLKNQILKYFEAIPNYQRLLIKNRTASLEIISYTFYNLF
jgi:hypothetical protein